jgi:hypothetical protein
MRENCTLHISGGVEAPFSNAPDTRRDLGIARWKLVPTSRVNRCGKAALRPAINEKPARVAVRATLLRWRKRPYSLARRQKGLLDKMSSSVA